MRERISRILLLVLMLGASSMIWAGKWSPVTADELHDPAEPGIKLLQNPEEALSKLPSDAVGNQVDWVKALQGGYINPRTNVLPETKVRVIDTEVLMKRTGEMPMVKFPHKPHTLWLECGNWHEHLFKSKAGASNVNMMQILTGEKCGLCHGAVAFPLTECTRCHSVPREKIR